MVLEELSLLHHPSVIVCFIEKREEHTGVHYYRVEIKSASSDGSIVMCLSMKIHAGAVVARRLEYF